MTNKATFLVAGMARSGLTAVMMGLRAGGMPTIGLLPDFLDDTIAPLLAAGIPQAWHGSAVKVQDIHRLEVNPNGARVRSIFVTRNHRVQAASQRRIKEHKHTTTGGSKEDPRALMKHIRTHEPSILAQLTQLTNNSIYHLNYEQLVHNPTITAHALAAWIGEDCPGFNADQFSGAIHDRKPELRKRPWEHDPARYRDMETLMPDGDEE